MKPNEPTIISATEMARNLSNILSRAQYKGEKFAIKRNGELVATITPPEKKTLQGHELKAFFESLPKFTKEETDEFEAAIKDMREHMYVREIKWD